MMPAEIRTHTARSETWLRNHGCAWCGQTLWHALRNGCGAIGEKCNPAKKDFGRSGNISFAFALGKTFL